MRLRRDDPDVLATTPSPSHAEATMASSAERSATSESRDFFKASATEAA